jgi:hypothetical protein
MSDPKQPVTPTFTADQLAQLTRLSEELYRTLRGHNDTEGLVTQVAILREEARQLREEVNSHLHEHKNERHHRLFMLRRVAERVMVWLLVGVLYLAGVGAGVVVVDRFDLFARSDSALSEPAKPINGD